MRGCLPLNQTAYWLTLLTLPLFTPTVVQYAITGLSTTYKQPTWTAAGYSSTQLGAGPPTNSYPQMDYDTTLNALKFMAGASATSAATAVSSNQYFYFTLSKTSGTFNVSTFSFEVYKGASATRAWIVRSSADNYATNIGNQDSVANTWTPVSLSLSGSLYTGLTSITFRIYGYSDVNVNVYGSIFFRDIRVNL